MNFSFVLFDLILVAFLNGTVRVFLINPYIGEKAGHIVSTAMLSVVVIFIVQFSLKKSKVYFNNKELLIIGITLGNHDNVF